MGPTMKPRRTSDASRGSKAIQFQGDGPNWILIAGSALLGTLSIRMGYKLKQVLGAKQPNNTNQNLKVNGKSAELKKSTSCHSHSNAFCFPHDEDGCCNHCSGARTSMETKEMPLALVAVTASEFNREDSVMWSGSDTGRIESPCISDSGSDIFSKREVIHKLRKQIQRRDDTILEMQNQIVVLQNSLSAQLSHSSQLQSLLDAANRDLFDSEREIQRLRKAIADHCVCRVEKMPTVPNGLKNGVEVEMLKREVCELKELMEGKDYLLQSYKEQKSDLSVKIKELQQRLDSQLPNIL